jgi:hypothetical protein
MKLPHLVNRHGIKTQFLAHPSAFGCSRFAHYINVTLRLSSANAEKATFKISAAEPRPPNKA